MKRLGKVVDYIAFETKSHILWFVELQLQNAYVKKLVQEEVQKQIAVFRRHVEATENARIRESEMETAKERKIRKEQDKTIRLLKQEIKRGREDISLLKREMTQLQNDKEKDKSLIKDLQKKLFSLQQPRESTEKSTTNFDRQQARPLLKQGETSRTQTDKCEDKGNNHGERITDLERHQQIADGRVDQQRERLNVLEQRANNQDERIDDLQPPAGKIFLTVVNHMQV